MTYLGNIPLGHFLKLMLVRGVLLEKVDGEGRERDLEARIIKTFDGKGRVCYDS